MKPFTRTKEIGCIFLIVVQLFIVHIKTQAQEGLQCDRAILDTGIQNSGAILQDRDGFLWIGTNGAGLFRYDGIDVKVYKPSGPNSLSDTVVSALYEDRDGILWIGTGGGGLNSYDKDTDTFTHYTHDPQNPNSISSDSWRIFNMKTICEDHEGMLWVGTQYGLNAFDKTTGRVTRYMADPADPNSISHNEISAILVDRQGTLWIGTNGGGLNRFNKQQGTFTHYVHAPDNPQSLGSNVVNALLEDHKGTFWIATASGLCRFKRDTETFTCAPHDPDNENSPRDDFVKALYEECSGMIWLTYYNYNNAGLSAFNPDTETFTHYTHSPEDSLSVSSPSILGVYEDRAGLLWIVNDTRLIDLVDRGKLPFTLYRHDPENPNSLLNNAVVPIYEDRQGILWIGTVAGLQTYDKQTRTFTIYDGGYYPGIFEDSSGMFWLGGGVNNALLSLFDRKTKTIIKSYSHDPEQPEGITQAGQINVILEDRDDPNILWLAGIGAGLEKFQKSTETFTHYKHDPDNANSISNNDLWSMYQDHNLIIWLPTIGGGVNAFDPNTETFIRYTHHPDDPKSLSSDSVYAVFEDTSGTLWFGHARGFDKFDRTTGTFTHYTEETGYAISIVGMITEDRQGNLWLGSLGGSGLMKFNPDTEILKMYTEDDGLQSNTFYPRNGVLDQDGELWVAGSNGMNSFYPEKIIENNYVPPIAITSFKQGGEEMRLGKAPERIREITLDWQQNFFEFEYAALSFSRAEKNQYKYILEGLDKEWYHAGTRRFGRYSGLAGGTYTLRIIGSNNDGVWNERGVAIRVKVSSPFWKTGWFYGGSAIALLLLIGFVYHSQLQARTNQLKARQAQFKAEQEAALFRAANREKEAAEAANRAKSKFLSKMSHELRTPLNSILGYAQILQRDGDVSSRQIDGLRVIEQSGEHLLMLINDILDLAKIEAGKLELNPTEVHLPNFLRSIAGIIRMRAEQKDLVFAYEPLSPLPQGIQADETRLRQVLLNLLGNAVKFTDEGHVLLNVSMIEEFASDAGTPHTKLRFEVTDTGAGIAPDQVEHIFQPFEQVGDAARRAEGTGLGLAISRQLVQAMKGELHVRSQLGEGTTFWFDIIVPVVVIESETTVTSERKIVGYTGPRRNVLIADDKEYNRLVLVNLLEPLGFNIVTARDGREMVNKACHIRPDVILTDLVMPVMTGIEAVQEIRQMPELQHVCIIAVSASVFDMDQQQSKLAGCDDFLPKPVSAEKLFECMETHLKLEWVYERADEQKDRIQHRQPDAQHIVPPPPEEMLALLDIARRGNMRKIRERAAQIERMDPQYKPFTDTLQQLAKGYEEEEIRTFLQQYRGESQ